MTPWPSAYTFCGGKRLIMVEAVAAADDWVGGAAPGLNAAAVEPGVVLRLDPFTVACGSGAMIIQRVKPEGRKEMLSESYLAGCPMRLGDKLG